MKKSVLKVQMFGTYSIEYEGNPVSFERNTTTKTNQLMQILLQAGEKGVKRAKITGLAGSLMNWMRINLRICWIRLGRKMTRRRKSLI